MRFHLIGFFCAIFLTTSCFSAVSGGFRSSGGFSSSRSYSSASSSYRSYSRPTYIRPQQSTIIQNNKTVVHSDTGSGFGSAMLGAMVGSSLANHNTVVVQQPAIVGNGTVTAIPEVITPPATIVQTGFSGFHIFIILCILGLIIFVVIIWLARQMRE